MGSAASVQALGTGKKESLHHTEEDEGDPHVQVNAASVSLSTDTKIITD